MRKDQEYWYLITKELLNKAGIEINGSRDWDIKIINPLFFKKVICSGSLGLGESYMDGWWECSRIDELVYRLLYQNMEKQLPRNLVDTLRVLAARLINRQSRKRAKTVARKHYDLGNKFFSIVLDPYMQYSCAYWQNSQDLAQAQEAKLHLICRKLELQPGMTLLDIGCGWGGLAEFAARFYGVSVFGVTISAEQKKFAEQRCAGLDVTISLQDYRDITSRFDRVVSVGMFEHVGQKNYPVFFSTVNRSLKPGGIFLLHTIGSNISKVNSDAFLNKYIFPNATLPSISQLMLASEPYFIMEDLHSFGPQYDKTLLAWHAHFIDNWADIERISERYDERFKRMFTFYLSSCAGAFRARHMQLWQIIFSRGIVGSVTVIR
ncbi:cyclopropane fatty acyl phospholipid synthase [Salmonella enterica]|uniref:cyclopropane fatty acyl phospholipid synthase n=1 Tax=Salmonella enterica TaxID=28901 RepID=UPI000DA2F775|nr:cyclopropane fatty acyl phospholipid synthase [Salmonella enterica]EBR8739099.1 cyclopropane fatty acyl phospholipid synthase [Salmonella enterica subsp. enterica serovar Godesberg]EBS2174669.1 cyclopropane fatty acyl phospholipid synthase [Salmonella enterica subsp. enterica serovar Telelkebir]ECA7061881.1 cyclopropane fatty acyl phospholipid synthase [Salmonella enterica subsp. enterica serovar Grumpensis]ECD9385061.1 cyclopropane fatty acyl phospholipid synthase [Salmonella enterica subsp